MRVHWAMGVLLAVLVVLAVLAARRLMRRGWEGLVTDDPTSPGFEGLAAAATPLGDFVMTWYSFQDNTPCNSMAAGSGRPLVPYVSVAVPFRLLKSKGGKLNYGDTLFVKFLEGRTMPNGTKHTGWVQVDDFCGDGGDDSYCYQTVGGVKYPNVDLYVGDFTKAAIACGGGRDRPVGTGQEKTQVMAGTPPPGKFVTNYGGAARGPGKCGDCTGAKRQQACEWHYTPKFESWWTSTCAEEAKKK